MTKKRTSNKKRTRKSAETSFEMNESMSNSAKVIANWWKRLKTGRLMPVAFTLAALCEPPEVPTPRSNAAKVIAKWWKRLKTGRYMRGPLNLAAHRKLSEVSTPFTAKLSNMSIMSTPRKTFYDDDNWEKVVAAAEHAELMTSPTQFALFEGNWEDVVAAAERVEAMFLPDLK
jgi:hypothetical protein